MLTDTHSHIHFSKEFPDVDQIVERARAADVSRQIIVGCTVKDSYEALEFVRERDGFWSTLGVHPHNADELTDEVWGRFERTVGTEVKVVALGETGLDYFRKLRPIDVQKVAFRKQLELAKRLDLSVVVHVRDAWEDAFAIMGDVGNTKVILHCFTGTKELAREAWKRGYHTSFSGVITYPKNEELREVVAEAPLDAVLIETDCPYLTPQSRRGKRNEPAFIVETAQQIADVRNLSLEEIGKQTTNNAVELLGIS